jgi:hypothetical protein
MNVANLQTLLRNQAAFLDDAGAAAKLVGDFRSVAQGLEPFATLKLDELFGLLRQAEEYRTTGLLPVKAAKAKAPKPSAAAAIEAATQSLRQLYDQAIDPEFSFAAVDAALKAIAKLTVPQLKDVARGFDIASLPTKKADIVAAIGQKIKDRREMHQRTIIN